VPVAVGILCSEDLKIGVYESQKTPQKALAHRTSRPLNFPEIILIASDRDAFDTGRLAFLDFNQKPQGHRATCDPFILVTFLSTLKSYFEHEALMAILQNSNAVFRKTERVASTYPGGIPTGLSINDFQSARGSLGYPPSWR
jgi:hypothetical protein